ncbi:RNA polymerase sigma factor [Alkalihalobacillus trypoxylicola]|uniref:RNA polymerase sigma factor n=1 Tax=Alkalihalobacillus trypoxylicola TaxID=519424 RepID=A0A162DEG3_9BACI|nr:RNA polymerase sigma factor [Alkalihalobacillus trypoxylicola]KYG29375.1 RNA polymerase subunit sigma [Alkalihalobacillus trypoxylicola]
MEKTIVETWFELYETDITSYLIYYTGKVDVEDLVQDTFLIALKKMNQFKKQSNPKTWLISIARNQVIDKYRRQELLKRILSKIKEEPIYYECIEKKSLTKLEHEELYTAILQLKPFYREVVILRGILEIPAKEVGQILQCRLNKVHVTYHRALKQLKIQLMKEGQFNEYRTHS